MVLGSAVVGKCCANPPGGTGGLNLWRHALRAFISR